MTEEDRSPGPPGRGVGDGTLDDLQAVVGHRFSQPELIERALTHRSYANEREDDVADNEVMEFLGDAVLGLVVSELLYLRHGELTEGEMSKAKAYLVSADTLARCADEMEIGRHLNLGRGEEKTAGRAKDSLLANAFEAIIAAVYLDGGLDAARDFIDRTIWPAVVDGIEDQEVISDFKSLLQERLQADGKGLPEYRVVEETGPDHEKLFRVEVLIGEEAAAEGVGKTKKAAEQLAAERALVDMTYED